MSGSGWGPEIGACSAVGDGADAGFTTEVGTPLGVVTPARLLKNPPVPGKLLKLPPPEPGAFPMMELHAADIGQLRAGPRTLGPDMQRKAMTQRASTTTRMRRNQ